MKNKDKKLKDTLLSIGNIKGDKTITIHNEYSNLSKEDKLWTISRLMSWCTSEIEKQRYSE